MQNLMRELYENQKLNEAVIKLMMVLETKGFDPSFYKDAELEGSYVVVLNRKNPKAVHNVLFNRVRNTVEYTYGVDDEDLWIEKEIRINKYKLSTLVKLIEETISAYDK